MTLRCLNTLARRLLPAVLAMSGLRAAVAADPDPFAAPVRPNLHLLAIAVEDYQDETIPDLTYTIDDALSLVWWAETQRGHLYDKVYATALTGEYATRAEIIRHLQELAKRAHPNDQLILFLGGHGVIEPQSGRYHYLPVETNDELIAGTGLSQGDILELIRPAGVDPQRLVLLFDTCQSGKLIEAEGARALLTVGAPELPERRRAEVDVEGAGASATLLLAAAGGAQLAGEKKGQCVDGEPEEIVGHGYFTCSLLRGLTTDLSHRSGHPDVLTFSDLQTWVDRDLPLLNREWKQDLTSKLEASGGGGMLGLGWVPGTEERCDEIDNDLDGRIDEGFADEDSNGLADCRESEVCNGLDDDDDGQVDEGLDADGDGYLPLTCLADLGTDCDDTDPSRHPGRSDYADRIDNDCDGAVDEASLLGPGGSLPLTVYQERQRQRRRVGAALLGTATSIAIGGLAWSQLQSYTQGPDAIEDPDVQSYQRHSALTLTGLGAAAVGVGFSIHFGLEAVDFHTTVVAPTAQSLSAREAQR